MTVADDTDKCIRCKKERAGLGVGGLYCQPCVDSEDYEEDDSIRCPFCLHVEEDELWEVVSYEEGIWERDCPECCKSYEVETLVSYSFRSPPKGYKELG